MRNMGREGGFGGVFRNPPVKVGDEIDVKIEAVGEKGDGIAKKDGFVLFVPSVKQGDEVRIKITKISPKFGFAEVVGSAQKQEGEQQSEAPAEETGGSYEESEESGSDGSEDSDDFGEEEKQ